MGLAVNAIWKKLEVNSVLDVSRYSFSTKKNIHQYAKRSMEQAVDLAMQEVHNLKPVMVKVENPKSHATETVDAGPMWSSVWVQMDGDRWTNANVWFLTIGMRRLPQNLDLGWTKKPVAPLLCIDREYGVELGLTPFIQKFGSRGGDETYRKLRPALDELLEHALQRAEFYKAFRHSA